jgi:hypothetical protein
MDFIKTYNYSDRKIKVINRGDSNKLRSDKEKVIKQVYLKSMVSIHKKNY